MDQDHLDLRALTGAILSAVGALNSGVRIGMKHIHNQRWLIPENLVIASDGYRRRGAGSPRIWSEAESPRNRAGALAPEDGPRAVPGELLDSQSEQGTGVTHNLQIRKGDLGCFLWRTLASGDSVRGGLL